MRREDDMLSAIAYDSESFAHEHTGDRIFVNTAHGVVLKRLVANVEEYLRQVKTCSVSRDPSVAIAALTQKAHHRK
jgi:hypothetical protein